MVFSDHASLTAAATASSTAHTVSAWSLLAHLVLGLAVILVIIYVATRFLGGKGRRAIGTRRREAPISVLARQSMGKGVSVVIVQAGGATYLLGVTSHNVTRLDRLNALEPEPTNEADAAEPGDAPLLTSPWDRQAPPWGSMVRKLQDRSVRK